MRNRSSAGRAAAQELSKIRFNQWFLSDLGVIEGIREGTVISALITGIIARFFLRVLGGWKEGRRVLWFYK